MYLSWWFGGLQCSICRYLTSSFGGIYVSCWYSLTSFYSFWIGRHMCPLLQFLGHICLFCVLHIVVFPIVNCIVLCLIVLIVFWIIRHLCLTDASQGIRHTTLLARCKETTKEGTGSFLLLDLLSCGHFLKLQICLLIFSGWTILPLMDQSIRFVMVWGKNIDVCWVWLLIGLPSLSTESLHEQYQKIRTQWKG